jgi:N-acetylglucosamine-6-phosphate deacetylase
MYGGTSPESVAVVTISCEVDEGDRFLTHLRTRRVPVSLGHCNASFERAQAAVAAGAAAVTHMFNCCSCLSNRNPGYTGLLPPPCTCAIGIIADGIHVHDASLRTGAQSFSQIYIHNSKSIHALSLSNDMLRTAHCCAGDRVSLVTDAVAAAGLDDGEHCIAGQRIAVNNGRAVVAATGVLVRIQHFCFRSCNISCRLAAPRPWMLVCGGSQLPRR